MKTSNIKSKWLIGLIFIIIEICIITFIGFKITDGINVVVYTDIYNAANCQELELIYNAKESILCNERIRSNFGFYLELNKNQWDNAETLFLKLPDTDNTVTVSGVAVRLFDLSLGKSILFDNVVLEGVHNQDMTFVEIPEYAVMSIKQRYSEFYYLLRVRYAALGLWAIIVEIYYFNSIYKKLSDWLGSIRQQKARILMLKFFDSFFPVLVIYLGLILNLRKIDLQFRYKDPPFILMEGLLSTGFIFWLIIRHKLKDV